MDFLDGRKWTERRIATWGVGLGLFNLLLSSVVAIYVEVETTSLSKKTFCFDKVDTRLERINSGLYELPRLISGCQIAPKTYCQEARSKVDKTKELSFELGSLLDEKNKYRPLVDELTSLLNETQELLKVTEHSKDAELIERANKVNNLRHSFSLINIKDVTCEIL